MCAEKCTLNQRISEYPFELIVILINQHCLLSFHQVAIPALNDSKYIGMSVYNVVILSSIGAAVSLLIYDDPPLLFIFTSSLVLFCTTVTLIVIFLPKVSFA